jgi:hypothetical protein
MARCLDHGGCKPDIFMTCILALAARKEVTTSLTCFGVAVQFSYVVRTIRRSQPQAITMFWIKGGFVCARAKHSGDT